MGDKHEVGVLQKARTGARLAEIAVIIGIAYLFLLAPAQYVTGPTDWKEAIAGLIGSAFWVGAAYVIVTHV